MNTQEAIEFAARHKAAGGVAVTTDENGPGYHSDVVIIDAQAAAILRKQGHDVFDIQSPQGIEMCKKWDPPRKRRIHPHEHRADYRIHEKKV